MFFGYPLAATAENWLHHCLCEVVEGIHESLRSAQPSLNWPQIISPDTYEKILNRRGLLARLDIYQAHASRLTLVERIQVGICLRQQNKIPELCSCAENCDTLDKMPLEIQSSIEELFGFAFSLLTDLGIRDKHYSEIYNLVSCHVCPFCGCEYFDAPGAPREDLDHYLPKSLYPFAAVNLRNLVPMGMRCNERYKMAKDMLIDAQGVRRRSFDPYAEQNIKVSLTKSIPFAGAGGINPQWIIDFQPDSSECITWDQVFSIRTRITRDVLNSSFNDWLMQFAIWFRKRIKESDELTVLLDGIKIYIENISDQGFAAREFLRVPVFEMIHYHCSNGNDRLSKFMVDLVKMPY